MGRKQIGRIMIGGLILVVSLVLMLCVSLSRGRNWEYVVAIGFFTGVIGLAIILVPVIAAARSDSKKQ